MKILIATPAYGEQVYRGYTESVANLVLAFARAFPQVEFHHKLLDLPVLATARNILASIVMNDESYSHLLFIDADMAFSPMLIAKMLAFKRPFIGAIYPVKRSFFQDLAQYCSEDMSTLQAQMVAATYVCEGDVVAHIAPDGQRVIRVLDGFVQTTASGTGVMLVERSALMQMRERDPALWMEEPGQQVRDWGLESGGLFRGFDSMVNSEGYHVGEDIAFCLRWTMMGGEIWAAIDEAIVHSGHVAYRGMAHLTFEQSGAVLRKRAIREVGRYRSWWERALKRGSSRR